MPQQQDSDMAACTTGRNLEMKVATIEAQITAIHGRVERLEERDSERGHQLVDLITRVTRMETLLVEIDKKLDSITIPAASDKDGAITWKWLVDKAIWPISMLLIAALINYMMSK